MVKHTKEYAEKLAKDIYPDGSYWLGSSEFISGYMKAIEETNVAGLLEALKELVKKIEEIVEEESMELMDDDKAIIQRAINEIKKAE